MFVGGVSQIKLISHNAVDHKATSASVEEHGRLAPGNTDPCPLDLPLHSRCDYLCIVCISLHSIATFFAFCFLLL